VVSALAGCSPAAPATVTLTAKDFGNAWPFTVSAVQVVCARSKTLFVTVNGKGYALNGEAERHPERYPTGQVGEISEIQRADPSGQGVIPGEGSSLATVTSAAIARCAESKK